MVARTHQVLDDLGVSDADAQRVLTVASIAEVEAGSKTDYGKVAQVIDNRLANKLHNGGKLQLDSTVSYAVGKRTLTTTAAERAVDSPYNTYRYAGSAGRADLEPRQGRDRRRPAPQGRAVAVLRDRRPEHRRDEVRGHPRGALEERQAVPGLVPGAPRQVLTRWS